MKFDGGQAQLLRDLRVFDLLSVLEREPLDPLGHIGAGRNGAAAPERLELDVGDDAVLVDTDLQLHHIAAPDDAHPRSADGYGSDRERGGNVRRGADKARTDILVILGERADLYGRDEEGEAGGRVSYQITRESRPDETYVSGLLVV